MTQEAVAPYSLSGVGLSDADLASLYALSAGNAGGATSAGIGGLPSLGDLGANYVDTSGAQLITAPISNKGNPTAYGGNNQFYIQPNELVRVVDRGTNSVIFEGVGPDAAREAVKIGQNLTDTMGRKADYQIQAGLTPDRYAPVANEKYNKTDLQNIAGAVGTALPLAMIPLTMGLSAPLATLSTAGKIALGAGVGGLSSGLKGDNILKGAAIGGLSAAGGSLLPKIPAIGDLGRLAQPLGVGVGSTVGNLVTGQNLKNSLLSGAASGALAYLTPDIQAALKGTQVPAVSTGVSTGGGPAPIATVTGSGVLASPVSIGGGSSSSRQVIEDRPAATVTASPAVPGAVVNYTGGGGGEIMSKQVTITQVTYSMFGDKSVVAELGTISIDYVPDECETLRVSGKRYDVQDCLDALGKRCTSLSQLVRIEVSA
jgi:hypothetical protein